MKMYLKFAVALVITGGIVLPASAQEEKGVDFNVSGDFVSSYVWRGMYQNAQACVQPTLGIAAGGFSLTAWGSTSLADVATGHKELDLTLAYAWRGLTVQVADLWWDGQADTKYFNYESHVTGHHFEAGVAYALPCERFPLSVAWYTVFAGNDKTNANRQQYSSYAELNYPFTVRGVALNATLGLVPYESQSSSMGYLTDGFAVTNLALKATKEVRLSKSFTLPLFTQVIFNPKTEQAHLVLGFTIR